MDSWSQFLLTLAALGVAVTTQVLNYRAARVEARERRRDDRNERLSQERQAFLDALTQVEVAYAMWARLLHLYVEHLSRPYEEWESVDGRLFEAANAYAQSVDDAERLLTERLLTLGTMVNSGDVWASVDALVAPLREATATTSLRTGDRSTIQYVLLPSSAQHMETLRSIVKEARGLPLRPSAPGATGVARTLIPALRARVAARRDGDAR